MTFYIKPPEGNVSLSSLYQYAETRLLFLSQVHQRWGDDDQVRRITTDHPSIRSNSECLIEGSRKDRMSHFVLRLATLGNEQFRTFFIEAETLLFEHRLQCGGEPVIINGISDFKRHIHFALKYMRLTTSHHTFILQVQKTLNDILRAGMVACTMKETCHHFIKVPWTMVESLVKERSVAVNASEVVITCQTLLLLLYEIFKTTLEFGIKQLSLCGAEDLVSDTRIRQVKKNIIRVFIKHQGGSHLILSSKRLCHTDIENEVPYFPLCMQELHKILSSTSRLRHHARIRYTLFLKDIGLPVMENIAFWENFYCKPHLGHSAGCCHTWEGNDRKRYTYGIRHLYGIEGGRKNYTSHSCTSLQALLPQPLETGGCPYASYDEAELSLLLNPILKDHLQLQNIIMKEVKAGRPNAACKIVLAFTLFIHKEHGRKRCKKKDMQHLEDAKDKRHYTYNLSNAESCNTSNLTLKKEGSVSEPVGKTHCQVIHDLESLSKNMTKNNNEVSLKPEISSCNDKEFRHSGLITKSTTVNDSACIKHCSVNGECFPSSSSVNTPARSCNGVKNDLQVLLCDIEDLKDILPKCNVSRPSQYYLKARGDAK
ncbi:uncharacterized protein [Cherax quadricarinatus]